MIHEVAENLGQQLRGRKCPIPVVDGPEIRPTTTFARERIVVEHDQDIGDDFVTRHKADINPRTWLTRNTGVKITIYAKAPGKGSIYWEHKRRAEKILDMVLCALNVVSKVRENLIVFKGGRFVFPETLAASETFGGAVYELKLTFDRGVADRNWDDSGDATAMISPQMVGGPSVTFAASAHTITRLYGSWLSDGFIAGQTLIVTGSAHNDGTTAQVKTVTATMLTLVSGLANEGPVTGVTITGNGVVTNNTTTAIGPDGSSEIATGNGGT